MTQAKGKIFWPGMKGDLQRIYQDCPSCQENKESKANEHNEIGQEKIFENFLPGQQVELDFDKHEDKSWKDIEFGAKVLRYTSSAFERQLLESVTIQGNITS